MTVDYDQEREKALDAIGYKPPSTMQLEATQIELETRCLRLLMEALLPLDGPARRRVLRYAELRFAEPSAAKNMDAAVLQKLHAASQETYGAKALHYPPGVR